MTRLIGPEAETHLDWIGLTDALAAGHDLPVAELEDVFLYQGNRTLLNRSAWIAGLGLLVKAATVFPDNPAQGRPMVGGAVNLMSDDDGSLTAVLDFALVTKWKTAADSLLAARRLARPDSRDILIVGAGTVGASLRQAYAAAFPDARFTIWNRSADGAARFAAEHGARVAQDLESAVRAADIVTSATMTSAPILQGDWFHPGQHIDLIGAYRPDMREADDAALRRARIFVDNRRTTMDHIGELKDPLARGVITPDDIIADYYQLDRFTRSPDDITLFKNGGGGHLDLMTADYIQRQVQATA
ncbi:NAD(P)-binding domain-containing protein [Loktanella sp. SALINAS62]|uniref:ornithine cyclodeaminase family protein n=1 Tax=Loktanella sp. SALINAS62 TaxID=2706124 RepID=UPI001B8B5D34|nr:NAD(P)-binding domain-containing protein [Loktanella sp. SALINAS62]MBS1302104.1 NAD(P)-binding domain-containing protein [Loktanella sp. SALINAS62]